MPNYNKPSMMAPIDSPLMNEFFDVGRSRHNLNCMRYFKGVIGLLMPFHIVPAFPNTDISVGYDVFAECSNPLKKKIFNGLTAYVHTFKVLFNDTWEGFSTYIQHGQDGDIVLNAPLLRPKITVMATNFGVENRDKSITIDTRSAYAPSSYMGVDMARFNKSIQSGNQNRLENNLAPQLSYIGSDSTDSDLALKLSDTVDVVEYPEDFHINALYFIGFLQIFKSKYLNHNLLTKNKSWFPDNIMHFCEGYGTGSIAYLNYGNFSASVSSVSKKDEHLVHLGSTSSISDVEKYIKKMLDFSSSCVPQNVTINDDPADSFASSAWLNLPRFRQAKGDYFISSSPFANLMRGTAPQINIEDLIGTIDWSSVLDSSQSNYIKTGLYSVSPNALVTNVSSSQAQLNDVLSRAIVNVSGRIPLSLQQFREVTAYSIMLERNAKTDGTYNEIVKAQFGVSPKQNQHEPFYVGGANYNIYSTEVIQQSESSNSFPLGSQSGRMVGSGSSFIGKTHFEDFGFLMSIMSIVPDNIYTSGIDRFLTDYLTDDVYFPILNNLSADVIKNMELFVSNQQSDNEDAFSWKQRFDQYRSSRNRALNDFILPHSIDDESASRLMSRRFTQTPAFNNDFVTLSPKNVDMSVFSNAYEAPFDISVGCRVDWVGPLPSESNPATFGMLRV